MFSREEFGKRVKEARQKAGETQTDLGLYLGVKKSQVSELENGNTSTTVENVAMICEHYKISADYLLGLKDEP